MARVSARYCTKAQQYYSYVLIQLLFPEYTPTISLVFEHQTFVIFLTDVVHAVPELLFLESLELADAERFNIPGVDGRELSLSEKPSPSCVLGCGVSSFSNKRKM